MQFIRRFLLFFLEHVEFSFFFNSLWVCRTIGVFFFSMSLDVKVGCGVQTCSGMRKVLFLTDGVCASWRPLLFPTHIPLIFSLQCIFLYSDCGFFFAGDYGGDD